MHNPLNSKTLERPASVPMMSGGEQKLCSQPWTPKERAVAERGIGRRTQVQGQVPGQVQVASARALSKGDGQSQGQVLRCKVSD